MILWLVACLAFVALGLAVSVLDGWDLKGAAAIVIFAILALYPAALLVFRRSP